MTEVNHKVQSEFVVSDKATGPLKLITAAAGRMSSAFSHATNLVGTFAGGIAVGAAGFQMAGAVKETSKFIEQIERMSRIARLPVDRMEALVDVFDNAGIEASSVEAILFKLNKQTDSLTFRMDATGKAVRTGPLAMLDKLGISLKKGPDEALIQLAEKAKQGKVDVTKLAQAFWLSKDKAYDLYKVLQKGGVEFKKKLDAAKQEAFITKQLVKDNERFLQAQRDLGDAWQKTTRAFGAAFIPVLAGLTEKVAANMEQWVSHARDFGTTLGKFLADHHAKLLTIGKLLMVQFTLQKTLGTGVIGTAKRGWGMASSAAMMLGFGAKAAAATAPAAGAAAAGGAAASGGAAVGAAGAAKGGAAAVAAVGAGPVLLVLAAIALIVAGIYATWVGIKKNVNGVADRLGLAWERIVVHFESLWGMLKRAFAPLGKWLDEAFGGEGEFGQFLLGLLPEALNLAVQLVERVLFYTRVAFVWARMMAIQIEEVWPAIKRFGEAIWEIISDAASQAWGVFSGLMQRLLGPFLDMVKGAWTGLKWIGSMLAKVADPVWEFLKALGKSFLDLGKQMAAPFVAMAEGLRGLWNWIMQSPFAKWIGKKLGGASTGMLDNVAAFFKPSLDKMTAAWEQMGSISPLKAFKDAMEAVEDYTMTDVAINRGLAKRARETKTRDEREQAPNFDFRGSHFDITQKFAEGFDPDRIAVAFANDLAMMGERKLQSGFSPIYSAM